MADVRDSPFAWSSPGCSRCLPRSLPKYYCFGRLIDPRLCSMSLILLEIVSLVRTPFRYSYFWMPVDLTLQFWDDIFSESFWLTLSLPAPLPSWWLPLPCCWLGPLDESPRLIIYFSRSRADFELGPCLPAYCSCRLLTPLFFGIGPEVAAAAPIRVSSFLWSYSFEASAPSRRLFLDVDCCYIRPLCNLNPALLTFDLFFSLDYM